MLTLDMFHFAPWSSIQKQEWKILIPTGLMRNRKFALDLLIDKNVHVPDNGHSARVITSTIWAGKLRVGINGGA